MFIYQLAEHLDCFYTLAIMNNATLKTCLQIFVQTYVFSSLGYIPRKRTAKSYGNSMFKLLRNC